jgi:hypothetical protein
LEKGVKYTFLVYREGVEYTYVSYLGVAIIGRIMGGK